MFTLSTVFFSFLSPFLPFSLLPSLLSFLSPFNFLSFPPFLTLSLFPSLPPFLPPSLHSSHPFLHLHFYFFITLSLLHSIHSGRPSLHLLFSLFIILTFHLLVFTQWPSSFKKSCLIINFILPLKHKKLSEEFRIFKSHAVLLRSDMCCWDHLSFVTVTMQKIDK